MKKESKKIGQFIDLYDRGEFSLLLNHGINIGKYVFVDDIIQGLVLAMEKRKTGEHYILGGENVSLKQLFELIDELSGEKHFQINMPSWFALFYSRLEQKKAKRFAVEPLSREEGP